MPEIQQKQIRIPTDNNRQKRSAPVLGRSGLSASECFWGRDAAAAEDGSPPGAKQIRCPASDRTPAARLIGCYGLNARRWMPGLSEREEVLEFLGTVTVTVAGALSWPRSSSETTVIV